MAEESSMSPDELNDASESSPSVRKEVWLFSLGLAAGVAMGVMTHLVITYLDRPRCVYPNDLPPAAAMVWLIEAERLAVLTEDIALITDIFSDVAPIRDAASGDEWLNPAERYRALFAETDYPIIAHTGLALVELTEAVGRFVGGSEGQYRVGSGDPVQFSNQPSSDHWTFGQQDGCWQITEFEFNAAHRPFPPGT